MPRKPIPMPEDMVLRDPRVRLRITLKHFLMRPIVHGMLGFALTEWLFRLLRLEAL
jgi:hypothetical protein